LVPEVGSNFARKIIGNLEKIEDNRIVTQSKNIYTDIFQGGSVFDNICQREHSPGFVLLPLCPFRILGRETLGNNDQNPEGLEDDYCNMNTFM
jgi:hypothetical protein